MSTYYEYRLKCLTEDAFKTWILKDIDPEPTTCPTDCGHTIDENTIVVVNQISANIVDIKQASQETGQNFIAQSIVIDAATGPNVETSVTKSWPMGMVVLTVRTIIEETHRGDEISNVVSPNTIIGILSANEVTGATGIHVSQTVVDNTMIGYYLNLLDSNNGHTHDCGRVIYIDKNHNIVYIENALSGSFNSVTYVKQNIYVIKDYIFGAPGVHELGAKRVYGSYLPANVPAKITYKNNSAVAKRFIAYVDFMY